MEAKEKGKFMYRVKWSAIILPLILCMILCANPLFAGTALDQLKSMAGNANVYVPEPTRPSPRPASYGAQSGGGYSSSSAAGQAAIAGGVMQSVFSDIMGDIFSDSPQQASQTQYVDPALIRQRELGEKQRLKEKELECGKFQYSSL